MLSFKRTSKLEFCARCFILSCSSSLLVVAVGHGGRVDPLPWLLDGVDVDAAAVVAVVASQY